jgi:UDP-N-acetylglucosamine--N-acetylmuramyl-(pentapeptide) pyrophosphoryl-undecaprenol N-acetylglucosamine transferase
VSQNDDQMAQATLMPKPKKPKKRNLAQKPLAVIAAGGTGGHMFPAEALARALSAKGWDIVLASDARGAQFSDHFPAQEKIALDAATFKHGDLLGAVKAGLAITKGVIGARMALDRLKPWAVIGFGGYPSLPMLSAALWRGDATLIHEQNAVLGRTNRLLAPRVDLVACAFPVLRLAPMSLEGSVRVVGNPVRPQIAKLYDEPYPDISGPIKILVTGGSQGSKILSENVPLALSLMPISYRIRLKVRQQARLEQAEAAKKIYHDSGIDAEVSPFFQDMGEALGEAHLVIGRAGASTVTELAMAGKPSILIPLKIAADDHQTFNAQLLKDAKASVVISEDEATPMRLSEELRIIMDGEKLLPVRAKAAKSAARPQASEKLADLVIETVYKKWGVKS